jgi:hypothetical protein
MAASAERAADETVGRPKMPAALRALEWLPSLALLALTAWVLMPDMEAAARRWQSKRANPK